MWFTSSRPDQVSYEDDRLGGVFTHFFIEALENAQPDRFGVTLEEIWEYARSHTQKYTSRAGRPQTPQKMIRNLTSTGPLYFAFPVNRSATLLFDAQVAGRFLVHYESGQLTELITKETGQERHVPMYPGEVLIERLSSGGKERQYVTLTSGSTVRMRNRIGWKDTAGLGARETELVAKGGRLEGMLLTERVWSWSGLVEFDYRAAFGPEFGVASLHNGGMGFRVDYGWLTMHLGLSYGTHSEDYQAWGYDLERTELRVGVGPALDLGDCRLSLVAEGTLFSRDVSYRDGAKRPRGGFGMGVATSFLFPLIRGPLHLYVSLRAGLAAERASPVTPMDASPEWNLVPWGGIGLAMKVF
jgi:hypothetical protein